MGRHFKPSRANTLQVLCMRHGWRVGAELGVLRAETSKHLLSVVPNLRLVLVDAWADGPGLQDYKREALEAFEKEARERMARYEDRVTIIKRPTVEAAEEIEDSSLDFIFVDADHRKEAVIADIQAWWPKVKKRGGILGHDADWPGVKDALAFLNLNPGLHPGNVWAIIKR